VNTVSPEFNVSGQMVFYSGYKMDSGRALHPNGKTTRIMDGFWLMGKKA
jgi:hypothetical protein